MNIFQRIEQAWGTFSSTAPGAGQPSVVAAHLALFWKADKWKVITAAAFVVGYFFGWHGTIPQAPSAAPTELHVTPGAGK